jgi:hypothetical protein
MPSNSMHSVAPGHAGARFAYGVMRAAARDGVTRVVRFRGMTPASAAALLHACRDIAKRECVTVVDPAGALREVESRVKATDGGKRSRSERANDAWQVAVVVGDTAAHAVRRHFGGGDAVEEIPDANGADSGGRIFLYGPAA